jgi:hypothetical protein
MSAEADKWTEGQDLLPRGQNKVTELSLGGLSIKVKTDATPALLRQTRDLVEARFEEYSSKVKGISSHQLAVLVAYTLGEELLKERERLKSLKKKVLECSEGLLSRVEAELNDIV